jgi:hypothetical protein
MATRSNLNVKHEGDCERDFAQNTGKQAKLPPLPVLAGGRSGF